MGDGPRALLEKSRGISLVLVVCPISDALITQISAEEKPLCGNAAVHVVMIKHLFLPMEIAEYEWNNVRRIACCVWKWKGSRWATDYRKMVDFPERTLDSISGWFLKCLFLIHSSLRFLIAIRPVKDRPGTEHKEGKTDKLYKWIFSRKHKIAYERNTYNLRHTDTFNNIQTHPHPHWHKDTTHDMHAHAHAHTHTHTHTALSAWMLCVPVFTFTWGGSRGGSGG